MADLAGGRDQAARVGLEQGIQLAVALSILRHVRHGYRPHTMVLARDVSGRWMPVAVRAGLQTEPGLVVYRFGADLCYANEGRFAAKRSMAPSPRGRHGAIPEVGSSPLNSKNDFTRPICSSA